jgi:endogenous inhibitor of DNA gyrase (YacG/DUF329 family)
MRCPICEREFERGDSTAAPFCSERCRLIDLGRWLGESYAAPGKPAVASERDADEPAGADGDA